MGALTKANKDLAARLHTILYNIASPAEKLTNPVIKEHTGLNIDDVVDLVEHLEKEGKTMSHVDVSVYMRRLKFKRNCSYIMEHPDMTDEFVHESRSMSPALYLAVFVSRHRLNDVHPNTTTIQEPRKEHTGWPRSCGIRPASTSNGTPTW